MALSTEVANIVRDAGGEVIGRTRLQKLAYLLEVAGMGTGFLFEYRRFGPYSDELSTAIRDAQTLEFLQEIENPTSWGGYYSIFRTPTKTRKGVLPARRELARKAAAADSVVLELTATALFLHIDGARDAWCETARRKPDKAEEGRLEKAKDLYEILKAVATPRRLPEIV